MPSILPPISFPLPLHSLSVPNPLPPLRYFPNLFICYPVSSRHQLVPLSTPQLVNLQCYSPNLFICYPVSSRHQLVHSSPRQHVNLPVTHRTCSSVTLSSTTSNMFPSPLVPLSSYPVQAIYNPLIQPFLVNYFYHLTFLSVLV